MWWDQTCSFEGGFRVNVKNKVRNIFVMTYSQKLIFNYSKTIQEVWKIKFLKSFNQKNICYEKCKSFWTLKPWVRDNKSFWKYFVCKNQSTENSILRKSKFILISISKISMWAYNLMVNNIVRSKYFLWKIIKLKYYFLTIYLDVLSKVHLQSNLYLQETR